ncbi:MAG: hypothetical protein ACI4AH_02360 [Muribaculaceae bacterium]
MATQTLQSMSATDYIYASLTIDGRTVASFNRQNFNSISEVIKLMYHIAGQFAGMARMLVRNQSKGWSTVLPLTSNISCTESARRPIAKNGQYIIPW